MQSLDLVPDDGGALLIDELPEQLLEAIKLPVHCLSPALGLRPGQLVKLQREAALSIPSRHLLKVHTGAPLVTRCL